MKFSIAFFVLLVLISFSCVTHKDYRYLIPSPTTASDTVKLNAIQKDYALQVGDVLDIKVSSNVGSSEVEIFNKRFQNSASNSGGVSSAAGSYLGGYIIDQNGNIDIPLIGKVYSKGLTCYQLNDTIGEKLSQFINYASVTTKLGFFRITILGEVTAPGTKELINNSNLNVYQAIGYAGDVTDVGDKKKVKLIRKDGDKVTVVKLDISGMSLIDSKYYYLQPNDVLYIEPLRAKVLRSNSANISLALSALTLIIVLLNYYQR